MHVVVPHTSLLREETIAAIRRETEDIELVDVSGSETAYWELFCELWDRQEAFTLIEHDVVIAPGTLAALESCPRPWCSLPSPEGRLAEDGPGWWNALLQANRFRGEAIGAHPDLFRTMPPWCRHWLALDRMSLPRLSRRIGQPHVHTDHLTEHRSISLDPPEVWAKRHLIYYRFLGRWAPERDEARRLLADMILRKGDEDLQFPAAKILAAYAKQVLAVLGPNAQGVPGELVKWSAFVLTPSGSGLCLDPTISQLLGL
jgi:hypothetical protein